MRQCAFLLLLSIAMQIIPVQRGSGQDTSLQFSQVRLISTEETVPTNHVWKVVGVAGPRVIQHDRNNWDTSLPAAINPPAVNILINSIAVAVGNPSVGAGVAGYSSSNGRAWNTIYSSIPTTFPLWLPAGTSLAASTNVSYVSVIEFQVQ